MAQANYREIVRVRENNSSRQRTARDKKNVYLLVPLNLKKRCRLMFLFGRIRRFLIAQLREEERGEVREKRKNVLKKCVHVLICERLCV